MSADEEKIAPVPVDVLADRLGLTVREFTRYHAQGLISIIVHDDTTTGLKITCRLGNRVWEGVLRDASIVFEEVRYLRGPRSGRFPR